MKRTILPLILSLAGSSLSFGAQEAQAPVAASKEVNVVLAELVEPLMVVWRDGYLQANGGFNFRYQSTMNSVVAKAFLDGTTPIAPFARDMNQAEIAAFTAKWGYAPTRIAVAMDALVVIVHKNNPIKEIKIEQLDAIYSTSRLQGWPKDITTWGDLGLTGSNWSNRPIQVFGHPLGSGTRDFYLNTVQLGGTSKPNITRGADILGMLEEIMANQAAIGYGSISQIYTSLKAVPLVPKGGKSGIEATQANLADGSYPLGRLLYIYLNKAPGKSMDPQVQGFLRYALSKEGQKLVHAAGFEALPDDLLAMNLRRLDH